MTKITYNDKLNSYLGRKFVLFWPFIRQELNEELFGICNK